MLASVASDTPGTLEVAIDRTQSSAIEVPETFTTTGDFLIEVTNAGEPIHVHLSCDDDLAQALDLETGNHFVPRKGTYRIPVDVIDGDRPIRGRFRFSVAYGAQQEYVELRVVEPKKEDAVRVDESLAHPRGRTAEHADTRPTDPLMLAAVAVGVAALVVGILLIGLLTDPIIGMVLSIFVMVIALSLYVFREM